ncbi:glutamate--cysteine ligase [Acidisphaera sp. L21]|uniref:glutamate--cysteine ligase n=1 Tax=Acidisphaera sp. L21 TaxID=1641851 RepID=UPI00131AA65F|nr:glutamate--cysteine ligase [Acidisphaera sp. L21]
MSNPSDADETPIASVQQLADHLAAGGKPKAQWRIGTEHEKFGFRHVDFASPPYEPGGIRALLQGMASPEWEDIVDVDALIGLKGVGPRAGASISLEPGGQFELSGAPLRTLHETKAELDEHCATASALAAKLGFGFAPIGYHPTLLRENAEWMPKSRYAIMRRYMQQTGTMGLDMMLRTCTVQVNLDYADEADMRRKLRVSLALQPLATALFASSPFKEGRLNGLLSNRAHVWTDVDADRTGMPAMMFAEDFGFERFTEWLLDMPMYFIQRDGRYIDVAGRSFRDFMAGRLDAAQGHVATVGDFADHVTTAFTDVRLKRFLEMRGADAGSPAMMVALSAFWVGLLYDDAALAAADALVRRYPVEAFTALRPLVPYTAMGTPWAGGTLRDLAREVLAIARQGLQARRNWAGGDESDYLDPLNIIAEGGPTEAEMWREKYQTEWNGEITKIFTAAAI